MNSSTAITQIKQALEKQDTATNPNLRNWDIEDGLNKNLTDWVRKAYDGRNAKREQKEESTIRIDDLQVLLTPNKELSFSKSSNKAIANLPGDYRYFSRLSPICSKGNCKGVGITSFLIEDANLNVYLKDWTFQPSFEFEETLHTISSNKINVFVSDFNIDKLYLSYYRAPKKISCEPADLDKEWEWKEDVAQLIIDETIKYLAGNTQNTSAYQVTNSRIETIN